MRRVALGRTRIETSCLGFGCASLGSRVGAAEGLRALEEAFEAGVTWLDLAPVYGRGAAETIAGRFLQGRREAVQVATKVGLAPPRPGRLKALAMPLARRAVEAVPALRRAMRGAGVGANRRLPLTPELVRRSLEESLRRLGTDRVDLYALHGVAASELTRDEILRTLEDLRAAGKVRALAVASDAEAAEAAIALGGPFDVVQFPLPAPGRPATVLDAARAAGIGAIVHSVFALDGDALRPPAEPALRGALTAWAGTEDAEAALGRARLGRAFALVPDGVVLASMVSPRSRAENAALASRMPDREAASLLEQLAAAPAG